MRRTLLVLACVLLAWGVVVLVTGGVDWRIAGHAIRSRAPNRAFELGLALLALHAIFYREALARDGARVAAGIRPWLPAAAAAIAIASAAYALHFSSFTAGGADSFGYVSQAHLWAHRMLPAAQPLPIELPWPSADASLAPLGYRPGPQPHTMVPTYAPGLPLMMAVATIAGACGPFLVVPLCAAVMVWGAFVLGRRTAGAGAGVIAAILAATSPIVLFMSLAPMSDIPAAALSTGAVCAALGSRRRDAAWCGLLAAAGLLVRPNLPAVPLVLFAAIAVLARGSERWTRLALYVLPVAVAAAIVALLNTTWYGSPWKSGYGAAGELFSLHNVGPNLSRYPVWLWRMQSPLVLLAVLPLIPWMNRRMDRRAVALCVALFIVTLCSYLVYSPFEEWWYSRFLLPAIPALLVLVAAGLVSIAQRVPSPWGGLAATGLLLALLALSARFSSVYAQPSFLRDDERRYADVGAYVARALPANAAVLAVQESGTIRYYGGRLTVRWDLIDRDWTPRAVEELTRRGLHPYLVIEDFEVAQFRDWFGVTPDAALPWPLVARMREHGGVSVFDLGGAPPAGVAPVALAPGTGPRCAAPQELVLPRR